MTDRRKKNQLRLDGWQAAARALAARLGLTNRSPLYLVGKIAQDAWRQRYYVDQPNMIRPGDLDPDLPTVLDALALVPAARYALDTDELGLIVSARVAGATWEQIGVALGAQQSGARQTARGKYKRLGGDPNELKPGSSVGQAPALVEAPARVEPATLPARIQPAATSAAGVPGVTFAAPTLIDVDQGGAR